MPTASSGFTGLNDARLISSIQAGDAAAFRYLYKIAYPALLRLAYQISRSREVAEDAVQSVLVELWLNRSRWRLTGSLRAYLYRAVRNYVLNTVRHEYVIEQAETAADAEEPYGMGMQAAPADAMVESLDLVDAVAAAVRQLPERQRTAAILHWYDGMTTAGVAEVMGVSRQAAEKLLRKCEMRLRDALEKARAD